MYTRIQIISLSPTPTQLQCQIIAVTILNILSGKDLLPPYAYRARRWPQISTCRRQLIRLRMWMAGCFPGGKSGDSSKRTNHLHLVPRLRVTGRVPSAVKCLNRVVVGISRRLNYVFQR